MIETLHKVSIKLSDLMGTAGAFALAILGVLVWVVTGPIFDFSNTWLLTITALTDVVVFLMVFSLQYSQNRDSRAIQLKLNELIVADKKARDAFVGLETLTDKDLDELDDEFQKLLGSLDTPHSMHKLHKKIAKEKARRGEKSPSNLADQAGRLVGTIFEPIVGDRDKK